MNADRTTCAEAWLAGDDDALSPERLAADPELARQVARSARMEILLHAVMGTQRLPAPAVLPGRTRPPRRRRRRPLATRLLAVAAVLAIGVIVLFVSLPTDPPAEPPVSPAPMTARVLDGAGLPPGDRGKSHLALPCDLVARGGAVALELPGGSRVDLADGGRLHLAGPRRLRLDAGGISCAVARTVGGENFAVAVPGGSVEVLGTAFTVTVADDTTRVAVSRGRVAVRGAGERELAAGESLRLHRTGRLLPDEILVWEHRAVTGDRPDRWVAGAVTGIGADAGWVAIPSGKEEATQSIGCGTPFDGQDVGTYAPDLVMEVEYHAGPTVTWVGLWARLLVGGTGTHYYAHGGKATRGAWTTVRIPLRELRVDVQGDVPPAEARINAWRFMSDGPDGALRVRRVRLLRMADTPVAAD